MEKNNENSQFIFNKLNQTGPGFCMAKWTQVTMHLGSGQNHSCHHPKVHRVTPEEVAENPSALHNSNFKKSVRKQMLAGERPSECDYCWRIEDNTNEFSDRVYKSIEPWSLVDLDTVPAMTGDENVYPRYVEVSFSNVCNFKCSYCGPEFSSKWQQEVKQHGAYSLPSGLNFNDTDVKQIPQREENPYVTAFWKWFPDAVEHMHVFRITGGEPLMSKHTMHVIDLLLKKPQPNLDFAINSNGNPPGDVWNEFTHKVQQLLDGNCVKSFTLYTSAESTGAQAEFSRTGMEWKLFEKNIEYFLKNTTHSRVVFMSAFNILSLTTFKQFLEYVYQLKIEYNDQDLHRVGLDTPYVRNPSFLDAQILTEDLSKKFLVPSLTYMRNHVLKLDQHDHRGFEHWEFERYKRVVADVLSSLRNPTREITQKRADFYSWQQKYYLRRELNFLDYFPEMENFLSECEQALSSDCLYILSLDQFGKFSGELFKDIKYQHVNEYDDTRLGKHLLWIKHEGDPLQYPNSALYDGTVMSLIPAELYEPINQKKIHVIIDTAEESWGPVYENRMNHVESKDVDYCLQEQAIASGIDPNSVVWLTGDINAEKYRKHNACNVKVRSVCQFLFSFPNLVKREDFENTVVERDTFLICPNRFPKAHRGFVVNQLQSIRAPMRISFPREMENFPNNTIIDCHYKLLDRKNSFPDQFDTDNTIDWDQQLEQFTQLYEKMPMKIDDVDFDTNHCAGSDAIQSIHDFYRRSAFALVTETWAEGGKLFLSDAVLAPILNQTPFILIGCQGSLEYLRSEGFQTFGTVIDESYDSIEDDVQRWRAAIEQVRILSEKNWLQLREELESVVQHNFYHMFGIAPYKEREMDLWLRSF